jgi:hypothetical protein
MIEIDGCLFKNCILILENSDGNVEKDTNDHFFLTHLCIGLFDIISVNIIKCNFENDYSPIVNFYDNDSDFDSTDENDCYVCRIEDYIIGFFGCKKVILYSNNISISQYGGILICNSTVNCYENRFIHLNEEKGKESEKSLFSKYRNLWKYLYVFNESTVLFKSFDTNNENHNIFSSSDSSVIVNDESDENPSFIPIINAISVSVLYSSSSSTSLSSFSSNSYSYPNSNSNFNSNSDPNSYSISGPTSDSKSSSLSSKEEKEIRRKRNVRKLKEDFFEEGIVKISFHGSSLFPCDLYFEVLSEKEENSSEVLYCDKIKSNNERSGEGSFKLKEYKSWKNYGIRLKYDIYNSDPKSKSQKNIESNEKKGYYLTKIFPLYLDSLSEKEEEEERKVTMKVSIVVTVIIIISVLIMGIIIMTIITLKILIRNKERKKEKEETKRKEEEIKRKEEEEKRIEVDEGVY